MYLMRSKKSNEGNGYISLDGKFMNEQGKEKAPNDGECKEVAAYTFGELTVCGISRVVAFSSPLIF